MKNILAAGLIAFLAILPSPSRSELIEYTHSEVSIDYDGDNIYIKGVKHRLANADTPQFDNLKKPCGPQEIEIAYAARDFSRAKLATSNKIQIDHFEQRDRWDRPLVRVFLDGEDLGKALVEAKLACPNNYTRDNWCVEDPPECF